MRALAVTVLIGLLVLFLAIAAGWWWSNNQEGPATQAPDDGEAAFSQGAPEQSPASPDTANIAEVTISESVQSPVAPAVQDAPVLNQVSFPEPPGALFELPKAAPGEAERAVFSADMWNGLEAQFAINIFRSKTAEELRRTENEPLLSEPLQIRQRITKPTATTDFATLQKINDNLDSVLPQISRLIENAQVSGYFPELYRRKLNWNKQRLPRLDAVLSRHNYYDCETILELRAPQTGRRALLIQAEMDTLTDGSDGDRYSIRVGESATFQPFTSYSWAKRTSKPNPFLAPTRKQLDAAQRELNSGGVTSSRRSELRSRINKLKTDVRELKSRSYLVGAIDPFVALPIFMVTDNAAYAPKVGDYIVVIYENTIYPAIVGDAGPNFKMGEASYLIGKAINAETSVYQRPVNDLEVTYIAFPGTREQPFGPPDYAKIQRRCAELLNELGGFRGTLHQWVEEIGNAVARASGEGETFVNPLFTTASPSAEDFEDVTPLAIEPE